MHIRRSVNSFLRNCVFYPCSSLHGTPVKFLSSRFHRFLYCDYSITRDDFQAAVQSPGFRGYRLASTSDLDPVNVLGVTWEKFRKSHKKTTSALHFEWLDPFIIFCTFQREPEFTENHGPELIELMFVRAESVATLEHVFRKRGFPASCLVHVRSGIGCGGNYSEYPQMLEKALLSNKGGLPRFIFHDRMGAHSEYGDYLPVIERYRELCRWGYSDGGCLILSELSDDDTRIIDPASITGTA